MKTSDRLAIEGGAPVRATVLPYGRQSIDESDIAAVTEVLKGNWLTTGPEVERFESELRRVAGTKHAVAMSSGTAGLHAAMSALGVSAEDEVIVPAITFAASANCAVYMGARPVFADVTEHDVLIDPVDVERKITARTKAIVAVDFAGLPCDYDALRRIAEPRGVAIVSDACHSIGASDAAGPFASRPDMSVFSFHPVKHVTTAEGGAVCTNSDDYARRLATFRNHGITTTHREREKQGSWLYDMVELGFNYRLSDVQCALGRNQLRKLSHFLTRRREIAAFYDEAFASCPWILRRQPSPLDRSHAYHLYVVQLALDTLSASRGDIFAALRAEGIGANVHYRPVYHHSFYQDRFGLRPGLCPVAERVYERMLSLPIFPAMSKSDMQDVVNAVEKVLSHYAR